MTTLKAFGKSEDALLLATFLSSAGIEAVVVDDNSFGGNLLGATRNSIRIEVPDNDLEKAQKILAEYEVNAGTQETAEALPPIQGKTWYFDALVVLELTLAMLFLFSTPAFWLNLPPEVQTFINAQILSKDLLYNASILLNAQIPLCLIASVLLLLRIKIGRFLFLGILVWDVLTSIFFPPGFLTPLGTVASYLLFYIDGAIAAIMFLPPVAGEFRKRLTDRANSDI